MVVDASFVPGVLAIGIGFTIATLVTTWTLAELVYYQRQQFDALITVWVLGYRMDSYKLVDMRLHDINVVTDLNEQDPNSSTPPPTQDPPTGGTQSTTDYDGTLSGTISDYNRQTTDSRALTIAESIMTSEWTGPWPTLHIVASLASLTLLHITIDILLSVDLVTDSMLEWMLSQYGVDEATLGYYFGIILEITQDLITFIGAEVLLLTATGLFMAFDKTGAPPFLVTAIFSWVMSAAIVDILCQAVLERHGSYIAAGAVWAIIYLTVLGILFTQTTVLAGPSLHLFNALVGFLKMGGHKLPYGGARRCFGIATMLSLMLMGGLSIFMIDHYRILYIENG